MGMIIAKIVVYVIGGVAVTAGIGIVADMILGAIQRR